MRKIEKKINEGSKTKCFTSSNSKVIYYLPEDISDIYLHDNLIGRYNHLTKSIWINSCGWQTNTTKSRINALLDLLPNKKFGIFQKNFDWFIWDRMEDKTYPFFRLFNFFNSLFHEWSEKPKGTVKSAFFIFLLIMDLQQIKTALKAGKKVYCQTKL